jgi:hypothetical protein
MEAMRNSYNILVGKPQGKRPLRRPRPRWEDISEWLLGNEGRNVWTGCIWLRIGTSDGCCERGNEPLGSIKAG